MASLSIMGCAKVANDPTAKPEGNQVKSAAVNGSVSWYYSSGYYIPLVCDGVQVGYVFGWPIEWHVIDHYKNGELEWSMYKTNGSLTNRSTGEVFKIQESDKLLWSQGDYTFHANLIGNKGTHYILSGHFDPINFEAFVERAVCPNGPK
jgi:hypothetical protein